MLPQEPRLSLFASSGVGWINPFSGDLVEQVAREEGRVSTNTLKQMAITLAKCREAETGTMLPLDVLMEKMQQHLKPVTVTVSPAVQADDNDEEEVEAESAADHYPNEGSVFGLSHDFEQAKNFQAHMFSELPQWQGYDLAVHFDPYAGVSGDFYEVLQLTDEDFLIVLGDASGHGVQAALVVATLMKSLRFLARSS